MLWERGEPIIVRGLRGSMGWTPEAMGRVCKESNRHAGSRCGCQLWQQGDCWKGVVFLCPALGRGGGPSGYQTSLSRLLGTCKRFASGLRTMWTEELPVFLPLPCSQHQAAGYCLL